MKTYRVYFVRHGLIEGNITGQYIGSTDVPLISEGLTMLSAMKSTYVYRQTDAYFCSPKLRCKQTMAVLYPDADPIIVPDLRECDFGEFEGKTASELKGSDAYDRWIGSGGAQIAPPGGEDTVSFVTRVCTAFNTIIQYMMTEGLRDAIVCTHAGAISAILATYGLPQQPMSAWESLYGKGYCISVTPSVWMRGGMFEVIGRFPLEKDEPRP